MLERKLTACLYRYQFFNWFNNFFVFSCPMFSVFKKFSIQNAFHFIAVLPVVIYWNFASVRRVFFSVLDFFRREFKFLNFIPTNKRWSNIINHHQQTLNLEEKKKGLSLG
uniref:Uncharacterized protein n=1 Tax=Cacopsylla melanoneura TaxID=428564 RepID=A0A8D8V198_9HEMI